ncbi:MAG: hypothetical protein F6K19_41610 [Cyanothece sp. SIO1E1]|nr:hypothetical protein [Cyanothece sp. SIO1E1]
MPFTPDPPFPKERGNPLRSKDWNQLVNEVRRLDNAKVNRQETDALQGPLTINESLGIGADASPPRATLHVSGGNWNVTNTEGDLRIGSDRHRLKIGVATDGDGAGDIRIRAQGGSNRLMLGSGNTDVLAIQNGNVGIGITVASDRLDVNGDLRLRGADIKDAGGTARITLTDNGRLDLKEDNGSVALSIATNRRVGIRTTNPQSELDVNGSLRVSGTIFQGGNPLLPVGSIIAFAGNTTPAGFLECNGQLVSRTTYAALFSVIGTRYGSSGNNFRMPNISGRTIIGIASNRAFGSIGGSATHRLTVAEMPSHEHRLHPANNNSSSDVQGWPANNNHRHLRTTDRGSISSFSSGSNWMENTGGNGTHNNMQPYIVLRYCIKY